MSSDVIDFIGVGCGWFNDISSENWLLVRLSGCSILLKMCVRLCVVCCMCRYR